VGQHLTIFRKLEGFLGFNFYIEAAKSEDRSRNHVALNVCLVKGPSKRLAKAARATMPAMHLQQRIPTEAASACPPTSAGSVSTANYTEANEIQDD
jgi:hypothetical protein